MSNTNLSVNINKIATLRNARGEDVPNLEKFALECEALGADGITVHPRPDQRHIRYDDVYRLRPLIKGEFNIEGYPSPEFLDLVVKVHPAQVTLVPDAPDALTSHEGWDVKANADLLSAVIDRLRDAGIRTSIFVDTDPANIAAAAAVGTDRIELYTKPYADLFPTDPEAAVAPYVEASRTARKVGLGVNAGHDLNLDNLAYFVESLPYLNEVSIGHALISDSIYKGLPETVRAYKAAVRRKKK